MEEWKKYKLRDLISYMSKGIVPVYTERKQDSVLVLNQKCNRDFKIDVSAARFHDSTLKKVPNNKVLKVGDILINSTGTGTAGRVAQVEYLENSMTVDGHMIILRNNEKITPIYLGYAIKQKQAMIEELAEGSTGQTEINKTRLLDEILIRFPVCHKEQNMIALILKNLDDKIALNKRINDNLEQQALAIYRSWFVDFEPFKGGKLIDSELGKIPEEWKVGTLKDFVYIKYGKDHKKLNDGVIPVYGSGGIMRYVDQSLYSGESILIPRKGTLNNVFYVNESFWSVDTMFYTQMKMNNIAKYIYFFASTQNLASMNAGSAVPSMTTEILNSLKCIMAPLEIMEKFNVLQNPIFDTIRKNEGENEKLSKLRDTLLPQLMSGELKITDLNS